MHRHRVAILTAVSVMLGTAWSTSGIAHASPAVPDESGAKYSDAKKALSDAGFTSVVASRIGDRTALENCVVVNQHLKGEAQTTKKNVAPKNVLVAVDCNGGAASAKKPGTSAAAPKSKRPGSGG